MTAELTAIVLSGGGSLGAVQVVIPAQRFDYSYNDGYIDNVPLTLGPAVAPPVVGPKGNPLGLPKPHGCIAPKKFSFGIRPRFARPDRLRQGVRQR